MTSLFHPFTDPIVFEFNKQRKKTAAEVPSNFLSLSRNFYFSQERPQIFSIVALAEPILDITSVIDESLIEKYGLKWGGTVLIDEKDEKLVKIFEDLEKMPEVEFVPGGSAQNSVRVLRWCLNADPYLQHNFKVSMVGSIGDDPYKDKILNALKELGVNPIFEVLKNDKTSRCAVGIYKKEKTFATQLMASKRLSEEFVDQHINEIISHQALFIEGYMVSNKFDICKKLIDYFLKDKKTIILSLCAPFIVKFHHDKIVELANNADIITGNLEEAIEFSGHQSKDIDTIFQIIFEKLKPKENRLLVITDGDNGAYWGKYDYEEKRLEHIIQYFAYDLKEDEIQDLNGAGDAFLGGFLSKYMEGYSVHDCCKIGIEAATVILKNVGCTFDKNRSLSDQLNSKKISSRRKNL